MKKLLILFVVLLLLVGAGVFAVTNFNGYLQDNRVWLAERASAALGRPISFDEIGVSFRGGLGARVGNVSIGDDPAFSKDKFLEVGRADVVVKIWPALFGRYEVDRVVLAAPKVNVIRTKDGFNFDSIGQSVDRPVPGTAAPDTGASSGDAGTLPLLVSVLRISDGRLSFTDRTASPASELLIEHVDFAASDVGFDTPVSLEFAAAVLGSQDQNVKVGGTVGPIGSPQAAARAPIDLDVDIGPVIVDRLKKLPVIGESVPPELSSPDPMSVKVDVTGSADAPKIKASFDGSDAGLRFAKVFTKPKGTRFTLSADVTQAAERIDIANLVLRLADATVNGGGSIGTGSSMPVDFTIKANAVPLNGWGEFFAAAQGIDVGGAIDLDVHAKGPAASGAPTLNGTIALKNVRAVQPGGGIEIAGLSTVVALKGDRVEVPPTQLTVGGEPMQLSATVTSLKNLAADFAVSSPKLRLAAVGAAGDGVAKEEFLRELDVKGTYRAAAAGPEVRATVRSAGGVLRDVDYSSLNADMGMVGQKATLKKVSVKTFDGLVIGSGSYDMANANDPAFTFRGKVNDLDVAKIMSYLKVGAVKMTGKMNGDLNLDGHGSQKEQITKALTGAGTLQVTDGVLKGVNVAETILASITGIPGLSALISPKIKQKYPALFEMSDTAFEALGGKVDIGGGAANLKELALAARDYSVRGDGTFSFENVLDMAASFVASEKLTQDLLASVKEAKYLLDPQGRFQIPVRLGGSLPTLRTQPDTQYVTKQLSGALVAKGVEKGLDALFGKKKDEAAESGDSAAAVKQPAKPEDAAKELLRKGLGGLFGGKK